LFIKIVRSEFKLFGDGVPAASEAKAVVITTRPNIMATIPLHKVPNMKRQKATPQGESTSPRNIVHITYQIPRTYIPKFVVILTKF
jgi:hypothetical protein